MTQKLTPAEYIEIFVNYTDKRGVCSPSNHDDIDDYIAECLEYGELAAGKANAAQKSALIKWAKEYWRCLKS